MNFITKFKDLTVDALNDNKKLIIGLYLLFIISFIFAWIFSADMISTSVSKMGITPNLGNSPINYQESALDIFVHNEIGGIVTYISSILFGIPAIILLIYNGVNLGLIGQLFNTILHDGGLRYIIYLLPHGIFEITAVVLESVAGILLFLFIWNFIKTLRSNEVSGVHEAFEKNKKLLIQSLVIFIFSTILLIIAAPIEAYISVAFSNLILGTP